MTSRLRSPSLIYECYVEVSRGAEGAEPVLRYCYPKDYDWDEDTKKQIPKFTFPTRTSNDTEEHFTFVLTDVDGSYRFGFCRYPPKGDSCLCFLSDLPWYKVFYRSLDKIADLRLDHQDEVIEPFLAGLKAHPIPSMGMDTVLSVVPQGVDTGQVYTFPLPNPKRLPEIPTDDNFTQFYTNLHYNVILHLFSNLVFERRIIITSNSLSLLSATVHAVVSLIYPLHWQHIFIPITPPHLLEYCAAPMPFLMGIHSSYMDLVRRMPIEDVVLLDVDESALESPHVEDLGALPPEVISDLKHVLKKQSSAYGDTVARSFLGALVSMIGGYRSALKLRQGEKDVAFDEEQFLQSRPNSEEFLEKLLHFQHFRQFINNKVDKLKNKSLERDRFDEEVMMYEESTDKYKVNFDKFVNSTTKLGDQLKEGTERFGRRVRKQAKIVWKKLDKYQSHHAPGVALPHGKTHSLPMRSSASDGVLHRAGYMTPPPTSQLAKLPRKPPPVIPYHRHREGKLKLAESLKLQNSHYPVPGRAFTPDTPRSVGSGDQSERVSLDSRGSTDLSSGEVAVGTLIDISPQATEVVLPQSDTDSVSSASSSDSGLQIPIKQEWETFDDNETQNRPPLPPPRSEIIDTPNDSRHSVELPNESPSKNLFLDFDYEASIDDKQIQSELNFNLVESNLDNGHPRIPEPSPFESLQLAARPTSPFDDFSSSIAKELMDNNKSNSSTTSLASTGQDLAKTSNDVILENPAALRQETTLPEPLIPSTTAAPTQAVSTELPHAQPGSRKSSTHSYYQVHSAPNTQFSSGFGQPSNPFYNHGYFQQVKYDSKDVRRPTGPRSPKFAQDIPLAFPQVPLNTHTISNKGPPPPKPRPYSGSLQKPKQVPDEDSLLQRLPSIGEFNPFESLLGEGGMQAYVKQTPSKESPLV